MSENMFVECARRHSSDKIICKMLNYFYKYPVLYQISPLIYVFRNGHMLTHRNKKPYECKAEGCGKSYCDARSLRRHTENHHSSLVVTTTTTSSVSQNQSNSTSNNSNSNNNTSSTTGPPTGPSLSPATASGKILNQISDFFYFFSLIHILYTIFVCLLSSFLIR